jgi:uncharacterized protein YndB with AHSA1/START domain
MNATTEQVYITYEFNAPVHLVLEAWTDPEQLLQWFAPTGCGLTFKSIDVRKGGSFHSCISHPQFGDCWCKSTYLEVDYPNRLVFTMEVADENGNSISAVEAGMDSEWPDVTTVDVTFTENNGKTTVVLRQTVSEALAKKTGAYPSWLLMMDRLQELLK